MTVVNVKASSFWTFFTLTHNKKYILYWEQTQSYTHVIPTVFFIHFLLFSSSIISYPMCRDIYSLKNMNLGMLKEPW